MSGLKNTVKRMANASLGRGYSTKKERDAKAAADRQSALDTIYAGANVVPDADQLRRQQRKKAAKRKGSRVSTILTDDETLG